MKYQQNFTVSKLHFYSDVFLKKPQLSFTYVTLKTSKLFKTCSHKKTNKKNPHQIDFNLVNKIPLNDLKS